MLKNRWQSADNKDKGAPDEWILELVDLIEKEIRTFTSFLDALGELQQAIINNKADEVGENTLRATTLFTEAKNLSVQVQNTLQDLAKANSADSDLITLEKVIPYVESKYQERLWALRQTLITTLKKVRSSNQSTRRLVTHSLNFVNQNIEYMTTGKSVTNSYSRTGVDQLG